MSVVILRYLAMIIAPSIAATARPAATFFAVQLVVAALVATDVAELPHTFEVLVSTPMIAVGALLACLEFIAAHDPELAALMRDLGIDRIAAAVGAVAAALLFAAVGLPEQQAREMIEAEAALLFNTDGLLEAVGSVQDSEHGLALQATAVSCALAINLGLTWMRSRILAFVYDFDLAGLWARIETGGIFAALILLPFFPLLVLGLFAILAACLAVISRVVNSAMEIVDSRFRTPCEHCGYELRVEASMCPDCGVDRTPTGDPSTGLLAAWRTITK